MPAVDEVALDDVTELRVEEELPHEAVEQRGEPAYRRRGDQAVGPGDAPGFLKNPNAVGLLMQVIERSEDEDDVEAVVGERQLPCIAQLCVSPRSPRAVSAWWT